MRSFYLLCLTALLTLVTSKIVSAQSPICGAATEFCAENGLSFPGGVNTGTPDPGNNYGCLATQPNPAWYYMSTTGAGTATINLSAAPAVDIDFALWGPFTSLADALSNCGSLGAPSSCSYSPSPTETVVINSGGPGEFFLMLITNFSNMPTSISGSSSSTILGCNVCIAEGGVLEPGNQVGCLSTLDDIEVNFQGFTPDPATFGYTMVVTNPAGVVTSEYPFQTSLSPALLGPGTFRICGIAYELGSGEPSSFLGLNVGTLQADLAGPAPPFCGDVSDNCVDITIALDPIPSFLTDSVCIGAEEPNCPFINGDYICDPGAGSFTVQTALGCDSTVNYLILPRSSVFANDSLRLCPGEIYEYDGTDYTAPNVVSVAIPAAPGAGCDTTLFLQLIEEDVVAVVTPPAFNLTCNTPSILLESTGSSSGAGVFYEWMGPSGPLGSGTSVTANEPGTYTLTVTRLNPSTGAVCTAMATAIITSDPLDSGAPTLIGPQSLCVDEAGSFSAIFIGSNGPYAYDWFVNGSGSNVLSQVGGTLSASYSISGVKEICVVAIGQCGPSDTACIQVTINDQILASAGANEVFCELTGQLSGSPANGTWSLVGSGPGSVSISNPTSAATPVTVTSPGTYSFQYTPQGDCVVPDTVTHFFSEPLVSQSIVETCIGGSLDYEVVIELSGGTPPYVFTGTAGTLAGSQFTSNAIASGDSYNMIFVDANGCVLPINGSFVCNCDTDAGQMSTTLITACVPDAIQVDPVSGANLDPNDVGVYTLHTNGGATLGTVLAQNSTGVFGFAPPILANTTYYVSYVAGNDDGSGFPDPTDPCYAINVGQPVEWFEPATAVAGPDQTVCGLSATLAATGTPGSWTVSSGATVSSPTDPNATLVASTSGTYTATWTTGITGCTDSDDVEIVFAENPSATFSEDCNATGTQVTITITAAGGEAPYTVTGGLAVAGGGPVFTTVLPSGTPYSFRIVDSNGCESVEYQSTPRCDCITDAGAMSSAAIDVCAPDDIQVDPVAGSTLDPDDVGLYVLHTSPVYVAADELDRAATGLFTFGGALLPNTVYYVSYLAGNNNGGDPDPSDPCFDISTSSQPIQWIQAPSAFAGDDQAVCGLSMLLSATGGPGSWTVPAGVTLSNSADPTAGAIATTFGTYTLTWTTGSAGCTDEDQVELSFNEGPSATVTTDCQPGAALYGLSVVVTGGTAPYTFNGITLVGSAPNYSTFLPSGSSYSFTITDANGCESSLLTGSRSCDCQTLAPSMVAGAQACVGETINLAPAVGGSNDGNDIDEYVLYTGTSTSITTELARSSTPVFPYDPSYVAGQDYYVLVQRGNDSGGAIDPSDPCLDQSEGVVVSWQALPVITLSDATACEGDDALVDFSYTGFLPATFDYTVGGVSSSVQITNANGQIVISGTGGALVGVSLRENSGCTNDTISANAIVSFQTPDQAVLVSDFSLCNSAVTGEPTTRMLSSLIVSGGAGSWASPDEPTAINGTEFNAVGLTPGVYQLVFTTTATGSCPSSTATVNVTVRDCACPNLTLIQPNPLCNNNATLDLNSLLEEPQTGTWSLISVPPSAIIPATVTGSTFNGSGASGGSYRVLFTLTSGNVGGCPDTNSVLVRLAEEVLAGTSTGDLQFCEGDPTIVDLSSSLTGQTPGGDWTSLTGSSSGLTGSMLNIASLSAGEYDYQYEVAAPAPCLTVAATVRIIIDESPRVDAGEDQELTCVERNVDLGTAGSQGLSYEWTAEGNTSILSTSAIYNVEVSGIYTVQALDPLTGCSSSDEVVVTASDDVPVVDLSLQPISCSGETDGAIFINSIDGGAEPYNIVFNGRPVGQDRLFSSLGPGTFEIEISDANGCSADPLTFEITDPAPLNVEIGSSIRGGGSGEIVFLDTVFLEAKVFGDSSATVLWSPSEYVACDTCAVTYGIPPASLTYSVEVTTPEGCDASDVLQVIVRKDQDVFFPSGFSPNGDNVNDLFFAQAREGIVSKVNYLLIFNRWGELVWTAPNPNVNDPRAGWDGRLNGELLNPQVLVFVCEVEFVDGSVEVFKGDLSLIR